MPNLEIGTRLSCCYGYCYVDAKEGSNLMKMVCIAIIVILAMGLSVCNLKGIPMPTTKTMAMIETTDTSTETTATTEANTELTTKPTKPPVQTGPPATTEPPEIIDLQALIEYGREYAATTYGYEVCIGVRDGYYPADDHLIYTMEDGYKAVRASVNCTTRMLLARPGVQIVTEINGVLC